MKKLMFFLLLSIGSAYAQSVDTVIVEKVDPSGNVVERDIQYIQRQSNAANSFQEADLDANGCIDAKEAYNSGILKFNRYARDKKCLSPEEYQAAMQGN